MCMLCWLSSCFSSCILFVIPSMLSCNMLSVSTEVIDGICVVGREGGVGSGGVFTFDPGGMGRERRSRELGVGGGVLGWEDDGVSEGLGG